MITYRAAGVDRGEAGRAKARIGGLARGTFSPNVLGGIGHFGGLYRARFPGLRDPVLVASADSVGTKTMLAAKTGAYDRVAEDLVHHCANDILVLGARPAFFLDYLAFGRLRGPAVLSAIRGFARACRRVGCALIGGETAELPGVYRPGEYDVAGFIVGVVDRRRVVDGRAVRPGDAIVGLASTGLHTNGYSLARRLLLGRGRYRLSTRLRRLRGTVGGALLATHRAYGPAVWPLLGRSKIHGMAHITGGGLLENLPRVLPAGTEAVIACDRWRRPPIFDLLVEEGGLERGEAYRTFNMGIGYVLIVPGREVPRVLAAARRADIGAWEIGGIQPASGQIPKVVLT